MPHTLLLLLKGPLQSWGDESRFKQRETALTPTKSGVIGLLAAAQGRQRTDPVDDLAQLDFAVRVDQPGSLLRDYQTAQQWQQKDNPPAALVTRYYLEDAAFVAALSCDDSGVFEDLHRCLRTPAHPLFLGRRSCPAPAGLDLGVVDCSAVEALMNHDHWHASKAHRAAQPKEVELPIYRDGLPGEVGVARRDVPLSFAQQHRQYGWRTEVYAGSRTMHNPDGSDCDPFFDTVMTL